MRAVPHALQVQGAGAEAVELKSAERGADLGGHAGELPPLDEEEQQGREREQHSKPPTVSQALPSTRQFSKSSSASTVWPRDVMTVTASAIGSESSYMRYADATIIRRHASARRSSSG